MSEFNLTSFPLFTDLTESEIEDIFVLIKHSTHNYKKGESIVNQGDICKHLFILAQGSVKTEISTIEGGNITIANIQAPYPLASAFLFADNNFFPVDVIAESQVSIIKISKDEVLKMFALYPKFLNRYISFNSNITQFLSSKLHLLTIKTIKGKLAYYLVELANRSPQKGAKIIIILDQNRTELAKYFGIARPSLARTLNEMEREGLIIINHSEITINNLPLLKNSI